MPASHVSNVTEGVRRHQYCGSQFGRFSGLTFFHLLQQISRSSKIRRTVSIIDIDTGSVGPGRHRVFTVKVLVEVKYFRWCTKEDDERKMALIEFTDYGAVNPSYETE